MARLNSFIRSSRWWELVPSGHGGSEELVVAVGGLASGENYVAAAATPNGKLLVAYIPPAHSGSVTIDMTAMKPRVRGRWYDPTTGKYADIPGSPFSNKGTHEFTPPATNSTGEGDWVLVLEGM